MFFFDCIEVKICCYIEVGCGVYGFVFFMFSNLIVFFKEVVDFWERMVVYFILLIWLFMLEVVEGGDDFFLCGDGRLCMYKVLFVVGWCL